MNDTTTSTQKAGAADSMRKLAEDVADKAVAKGHELTDRAAALAETSVEMLKDKTADILDVTRNIAGEASERIQKSLAAQKDAGAGYVGGIAESMRRAAREFENDVPIAATYILNAASAVDTVADRIKDGDVQQMVEGAKDFARRQPTMFFGMALLAGFGAVRFLKSSAGRADGSSKSAAGQRG